MTSPDHLVGISFLINVLFILVPIALFSSLSRWGLGTSVPRPQQLRDEKRAMGTRMCIGFNKILAREI